MKKIQRRVSLIMAIVLLFNFIIPSLAFADISSTTTGDAFVGVYTSFHADLQSGETNTRQVFLRKEIDNRQIKLTVEETGLYTISLGGLHYYINNGKGLSTLASATYLDDAGNPVYNSTLFNQDTTTVTVYLKKGQDYYFQVFDYNLENTAFNLSLTRQDVDLDKVVELETDLTLEEGLGAYKYTRGYNEGGAFGIGSVHYQLGEDKRVSEKEIGATQVKMDSEYVETESEASLFQKVIVWLIVYGVCDTFKGLISMFVGEVSIDSLVYNEYKQTKLSFYPENSKDNPNPLLKSGSGILEAINSYFNAFRGIAYVFYLVMLIYVGIRVMISSTGKEKEKFKALLYDWFVGILILIFFPLVIKYAIILNENLVSLVKTEISDKISADNGANILPSVPGVDEAMLEVLGENVEDESSLMGQYRKKALDKSDLGYAFIYLFLLKELVAFIIVYYKRMITIIFLIVLFPFVAISYVFDKVKDGQAQIFTAWTREFMLNVFMQLFHAILYCSIMFIIAALMDNATGGANIILVLVGLGYLRKGDSLLKAIFPTLLKGGGAGTTKDIAETAKSMVKIQAVSSLMKSAQNMGKRVTKAKEKVSETRQKAYEHRANQNINNENRRAARLEEGRKRDAKDPGKLKLNFAKATGGISTLPEAEREKLSPEEREKRDVEIKREGLNNLNYAKNSKDPEVQKAFKDFMAGLKPEERKKLEKRMQASEAINMLVTKKGRDGVELTEEQLNINARIVYDITRGGPEDALYGDLYKWMSTKEISTGEKETQYRSKKTGEIVPETEAKKRIAENGERFVTTEVDKKQRLTEYFGITKDEEGREVVGQGLKGRVLTANAQRQKERLDKALAEPVTTRADGTKEEAGYTMTQEEEADVLRKEENQKKIQAMVSKFGGPDATEEQSASVREMAGLTVLLGEYQRRGEEGAPKMSAKAALKISNRMLELSREDEGAKRLMDTMVVGETPAEGESTIHVHTPGKGASSKPKGTSKKKPDTDSLGTPRDDSDAPLGSDSIGSTDEDEAIEVVTDDLEEMKLNLGYSVEGLSRRAARGVIEQNDVLQNGEREELTRMAVDTLRSETSDELGLSETFESDMDDIIEGYRDIDEDGFLDEPEGTQEEVKQARYEGRLDQTKTWYANGELRRTRGKFARATGEAIGATASATVGNAVQAATGITAASLTAGVQRESSLSNSMITAAAGARAEQSVERGIQGIGRGVSRVTTAGIDRVQHEREIRHDDSVTAIERVADIHRRVSDDPNNPKYEKRAYAREAQSRIRAFNEKISDVKKNK